MLYRDDQPLRRGDAPPKRVLHELPRAQPTEAEVQAMTFPQLVQARRDLQDLRKYGENLGYRVTILTQDRCPNPKSNKFEDC